jgi:ribosomal-protein-alanine N-acetyltransferase
MQKLNFSPFPVLTTERFVLRPLEIKDAKEIFLLRSDEMINRFLDRKRAKSLEDARQFIQKITDGMAKGEAIFWVIALKDNLQFTGTICLWNLSYEKSSAEVGFELLPAFHGKKIIQEVLPKIIEYGFGIMKLKEILGEVDPGNLFSIRLLHPSKKRIGAGRSSKNGDL